MIGKAKMAAGVLAAVAVLAAGCGNSATGQNTQQPAPAQSTTQPPAAQPGYDNAAFWAVPSTSEWAAYDNAYQSLMKALQAKNWAAATREYRHLVPAANAVLAMLRATTPEPKYQALKEHLIAGVTEVRNGALDGVNGMENSDTTKIDEANRHMDAGAVEMRQALDDFNRVAPASER